jgi:serine/threonine protein kinase
MLSSAIVVSLSSSVSQFQRREDDAVAVFVLGLSAAVTPSLGTRPLAGIDRVPPSVVHGDLFGENILVDEMVRPISVLDFGFLSTAGDPRLDASITAGIMNMYGPHAEAIATALTDHFATELGHSSEVLLIYRAAYAVATSNVFSADGSDGHFPWCVAQLTQKRMTAALGL